jgi:hypothetical protein
MEGPEMRPKSNFPLLYCLPATGALHSPMAGDDGTYQLTA